MKRAATIKQVLDLLAEAEDWLAKARFLAQEPDFVPHHDASEYAVSPPKKRKPVIHAE